MNAIPALFVAGAAGFLTLLAACQHPVPRPTAASLTVFPVVLAGTPSADVATVVGSLLERGGMPDVQVADTSFTPAADADAAARAAAFGAFVQQRALPTERALLVVVQGSRAAGITAVHTVLVDGKGAVVWQDRQQAGDAAFDRARVKEPLDCCLLVAQRLREPLGLLDPLRADAKDGKLGARMKEQAGVPSPAERTAMDERLAALRQLGADAPIRVLPPRHGQDFPPLLAGDLAKRLAAAGFPHATAAPDAVRFATRASSNEQAVLWSGAKSLQQEVRKAPAGTDYLLATDFLFAGEGKVGAVHCYLLSPAGEVVWVDYQNSHHDDFRRITPKTAADCVELAAVRVAAALR